MELGIMNSIRIWPEPVAGALRKLDFANAQNKEVWFTPILYKLKFKFKFKYFNG